MSGVDLTDLDNFADGFPHDVFARHRREAPVWWHEPTEHTPDGEGFWSVATYAEVLEVAAATRPPTPRRRGGDRPYGGTLLQDLPVAGVVLNMMDDPRHARIRRLVSTGLTPRMVAPARGRAAARTRALLDDVPRRRARRLPRRRGRRAADADDLHPARRARGRPPRLFEPRSNPASTSAGRRRRSRPSDATRAPVGRCRVRHARSSPRSARTRHRRHALDRRARHARRRRSAALTDGELYTFFSLLFAAGSETTRNAIAGGAARADRAPRPARRAARRPRRCCPTAIEEMLRWTTPSPSKRRTATRDRRARAGTRSSPATRCWSGRARPTATSRVPGAASSTSHGTPTRTSRSATASTSASAPPGPARDAGDVRGAAPASARSSPPASSGPAATATPASATSPSPSLAKVREI